MAYDKVIDSAQLDVDLTTVADAIRTKGGTTDPLSFPDGFVSAVEEMQTGGNTDSLRVDKDIYLLSADIITIGANSVSNAVALNEYFSAATTGNTVLAVALLEDEYTKNNQCICFTNNVAVRYKNDALGTFHWNVASYDTTLAEETKYLVVTSRAYSTV